MLQRTFCSEPRPVRKKFSPSISCFVHPSFRVFQDKHSSSYGCRRTKSSWCNAETNGGVNALTNVFRVSSRPLLVGNTLPNSYRTANTESARQKRSRTKIKSSNASVTSARKNARSGLTWNECFQELENFYHSHKHAAVPRDHPHPRLYQWCILQRAEWKKGKLSTSRYRQLSSIEFQWDLQFEKWKHMFYQLAEFEQSHGHCNVPLRLEKDEDDRKRLARWVVKQRHLFKHNLLPDDRRRRLEGLGFSFSPDDDLFRNRLKQLSEWREIHGHANVPRSWVKHPGLARWTDSVRLRWRQGKLPMRYYRDLRELGFCFAPLEISWEAQFRDLQDFLDDKGHCSPSFIEHRRLHSWLALQRRRHANGTLPASRALQLYELGVDWRPQRVLFAERIQELQEIFAAAGGATVPEGNKRLRQWVAQIRALGQSRISAANLKKLKALDFQFDVRNAPLEGKETR